METITNTSVALILSTAIQQTVELIDVLAGMRWHASEHPEDPDAGKNNALDTGAKRLLAFALAVATVAVCQDQLPDLGGINKDFRLFIWAVALSAGTDGVNSILKYLTYTKENKKAEAADKTKDSDQKALAIMQRK